jgi:hypothetical protein
MLSESSSPQQKNFFSERFNLSLQFDPNGGITGRLYPFGNLRGISANISGVFSTINSNIVLSFMCEFTDPNLTAKTFICFAGEIIKYEKEYECLILRWVMEQESAGVGFMDRDIEILLDAREMDLVGEMGKVRDYIGKNELQIIH